MLKILWSLAILGFIFWQTPVAVAQDLTSIFLQLPDSECGDLTPAARKIILETAVLRTPGADGRASVPDPQHPWLHIYSNNYMVLNRPGRNANITYKLFPGNNFKLVVVCRGRQHFGPVDPSCLFDLCLYRLDQNGLNRVPVSDYMPNITILDFITADTLMDPRARADILTRGPSYGQCLTCNANLSNQWGLDIITATTINAEACDNFLPTYGLLPLTWNGLSFTKPYNRAAPRE